MRSSNATSGVCTTASEIHSRAARISSSAINLVGFSGELGQIGADRPELREHLVLDQPGEQLDRRALRTHHVLADDASHDLEVAEAPDADALVPLGQQLRELVEILVLAAVHVQVDEGETAFAPERVKC